MSIIFSFVLLIAGLILLGFQTNWLLALAVAMIVIGAIRCICYMIMKKPADGLDVIAELVAKHNAKS
jgi:heme O synthase-like polyprenyltransferase